jgi:hypothetical protein
MNPELTFTLPPYAPLRRGGHHGARIERYFTTRAVTTTSAVRWETIIRHVPWRR